ncbi:hypothetical protein GCM10010383_28310 [Streptomyces lomondensis]|uniref:Uncharacterized protein n=1 Tax=Streptomyces lomondensis TaxID=68229 RepID=A0ABQ2X3B1_9ACTN|nr:hypothetical protein GCM10010383_28310 [Streptomyces lomondensis]
MSSATPCAGSHHLSCTAGACAAIRSFTPKSGRGGGRTADGRDGGGGRAEGGGADAGRTGRGGVDPPLG